MVEAGIAESATGRRHDLDALRAIAMLLGIVLHAALSFIPFGWMVTDIHTHGLFGLLIESIHGFRMPLFFLLSGFFTAMLWRKRGLSALLWHRFRRIFLPLLVGLATIVPLMFGVDHFVRDHSLPSEELQGTVWDSLYQGDSDAFAVWAEAEDFDPNALELQGNGTMLASASFLGHWEIVEILIERGADVNKRNRDGGTALHGAAFLGRWKSAKLLIDNGAGLSLKNQQGQTPYQSLKVDWNTTKMVAGWFQIEVDKDEVLQGREKIARWLPEGNAEGIPNENGLKTQDDTELEANSIWDGWLVHFPLFHHLWFLWFLCIFVIGFVAYALAVDLLAVSNWLPRQFVASPLCMLWLIPLTMWPQSFMDPGSFGPDTNVGILPRLPTLAYYALFFYFGALYWDYDDWDGRLFWGWWLYLVLGLLVVFPAALVVRNGYGSGDENLPMWFNVSQSVYVWLMAIGSMGLFYRCFSGESKTMRYVSDSSYWLYLAHLPLVILAQWLIREWQLPSIVKFGGLCLVVTGFLLLTYEYCVRYTAIGTLLNGKKSRTREKREAVTEVMNVE